MSNLLSVTWHPSPNGVAVRRAVGDVRAVVLHNLEGSLASGLAVFDRPGGVSAHYIVDRYGGVTQCVEEAAVAYHVAAWGNEPGLNRHRPAWLPPYTGRYSAVNAATIGIELEGYAAQGYTPAQYVTLGRLVAGICERWRIEPRCLPEWGAAATIVTHSWLQTDRSDPGPHFDWAAFHAALDAAGGITAIPVPDETEDAEMAALSDGDRAILDTVHGLGADAGSVVHWIEQLGAQDVVIAQLSAENAGLRAELTAALTAAKAIRRVTVEYVDGSSQEVSAP